MYYKCRCMFILHYKYDCIGGIMVSVLTSSMVDCGFKSQSGQTKDYKIGIHCSSAKHKSIRSKSKDWLARNLVYVSKWSEFDGVNTSSDMFYGSIKYWQGVG